MNSLERQLKMAKEAIEQGIQALGAPTMDYELEIENKEREKIIEKSWKILLKAIAQMGDIKP